MARLTEAQWEALRADYEVRRMTFGELADKYGVNKSNISRRAKAEEWNQEQTQRLIDATVENEKEKIAIRNATQQVNATVRNAMQEVIFDRLAFEMQSNADFQAVRDKAILLLDSAEKMSDVKQVADVIKMQREAMLGKAPDVAVQVNNMPERIERVIVDGKHSD